LQRDRRSASPDDFHEQLEELLGYFRGNGPEAGPIRQLAEISFDWPETALLGSSAQSAVWAADFGLPYVFADFINPGGAAIAALYRDRFQPSEFSSEPRTSVAVWALCADTAEEALRISASARMMLGLLFRGRLIAVPPVEEALEFLEKEGTPLASTPPGRRIITGTPEMVRTAIEHVAREYGAEEVFIVNIVHDHAARVRCYELIAQAFYFTHFTAVHAETAPPRD